MSELRIRGLQKSFDGHPVLHGIDLSVERGTLLALLGPSGSGKTTLLRLLCGFERADGGSVEIDGRRVVGDNLHVPSEQRCIGYVPQEGALFPHLSVADNIVFGLSRTQRRARHRVAELLELVGLPAHFGGARAAAVVGRSAAACCARPRTRTGADAGHARRAVLVARRRVARRDASGGRECAGRG
ncbi:ABC-type Fe3+/spermidine/putrescine transport system ATPase subunit [Paraburkholderia youngii]